MKLEKIRYSAGIVGCCLMFVGSRALAQEDAPSSSAGSPSPLQAEMQFDFRANVPSRGKVSSLLYSSMLSLRTTDSGRGPGNLGINVVGLNQYGSFRWQQAVVEAELDSANPHLLPNRFQAGILRLPFGIYDYRETYCSGLIAYPLPRADYAFAAVDWGVPGAQWTGGTSHVQAELARFDGTGTGLWGNLNGIDGNALRLQTYAPPNLILGVSGWQGHQAPYPKMDARWRTDLIGVDMRYTLPYLVLRGEVMGGTLSRDHTRGAYLDAYYRLPRRERFTLVTRAEFLKPATTQPTARQITLGGRWTPDADWVLALNWRRNNIDKAYRFTWTTVSGPRGELLFQILRRLTVL